MSDLDAVDVARQARQALASALNALQTDPGMSQQLLEAAEPIAMAMGALHRIERSQGADVVEASAQALTHARQALGKLQTIEDARAEGVLETVASSLGLVFKLTKMQATPRPVAAPEQPMRMAAPQPQAPQPPQVVAPSPVQQAQPPRAAPAPAWTERDPFAPAPRQAVGKAVQLPLDDTIETIEVDLGTHSPSNFYRGLAGDDVVENGGLFVATYQVPPIGQTVRVRVSLPGNYEFEAMGVVHWTREARDSAAPDLSPPGFGMRFTNLSPDARNLVRRYVANREPLFHDDL